MAQPLALLLYERLLPGGKLKNLLQDDAGYRVQPLSNPAGLVEQAEREKPIIVLADVEAHQAEVCEAISQLKKNSATSHIPVIAFAGDKNEAALTAARTAGATLTVSDMAILNYLTQFLDQALQVD
jgi:CheY-like chemotaxis protein